MINTAKETVYLSKLTISAIFNKKYNPSEFETLNEALDVLPLVEPNTISVHDTFCIGIGIGGHYTRKDNNDRIITNIPHKATDVSLYKPVPFIIRKREDDIDSTERSKYRFRIFINKDGVEYVAYYLKVVNIEDSETVVETDNNGVATTDSYTPSYNNLHPGFVPDDENNLPRSNVRYINGSNVSVEINQEEQVEIKDAVRILYGNENYSILSEMALYAGIDTITTSQSYVGGIVSTIMYKEMLKTVPLYFITSFYDIVRQNNDISRNQYFSIHVAE